MKTLIAALLVTTFAGSAFAADSCNTVAASKKLAGAAKTSFLTKCQKDAQASCDTQAADKKIYGAAKTSFTTSCMKDAVGQPPSAQ